MTTTHTTKVTEKATVKNGTVERSRKVEVDGKPEQPDPHTPRDVRDSPSPNPQNR
jgi:hypothetical protein